VPTVEELAVLMYRPQWPRYVLSGVVESRSEARRNEISERRGGLWLAPGGRYRADMEYEEGDRTLSIFDGELAWFIEDDKVLSLDPAGAVLPFVELLRPSWVLAEYELEITGRAEHAGRAGYAIRGVARDAARPVTALEAVIDAQLGLLLSYAKTGPGAKKEMAHFTELAVNDAESADPGLFSAPAPARDSGPAVPWETRTDRQVAELGVAGSHVSDELIGLTYTSALQQRQFSAQFHESVAGEAIAAALRAEGSHRGSAASQMAEFAAEHLKSLHFTARLAMAIPGRFRVAVVPERPGGEKVTICDGTYLWHVYPDRVERRSAIAFPAGFGPLLDLAWLLDGFLLGTRSAISVAGRQGLQVVAEPRNGHEGSGRGVLSRTFFPFDRVEAIIDSQLGVALRLVWFWKGQELFRTELSDLTEVIDPVDFQFKPAPGVPVHTISNPLSAKTLKDAAAAASGALKFAVEMGKRGWRKSGP
jgi:outer membrane lipoprotein-sorting protein